MNLAKLGCIQSIAVLLLTSFFQLSSHAQAYNVYNQQSGQYYGEGFYDAVNDGSLADDELIEHLNYILKTTHTAQANKSPDILGKSCQGNRKNCFQHQSFGYSRAKIILLGQLHLVDMDSGYAIKCVYCEELYGRDRFGGGSRGGPGPGRVPNSNVMNTEHTWPQSRFTKKYNRGMQRADLHHLFPTDSRMNSLRGNHEFGNVDKSNSNTCGSFKVGRVSGQSGTYAEPPDSHKGNVARAVMYFSVRYEIKIRAYEESVIREWNRQDPVDEEEFLRAERIFEYQGVRNPFIDHPNLADSIDDF